MADEPTVQDLVNIEHAERIRSLEGSRVSTNDVLEELTKRIKNLEAEK